MWTGKIDRSVGPPAKYPAPEARPYRFRTVRLYRNGKRSPYSLARRDACLFRGRTTRLPPPSLRPYLTVVPFACHLAREQRRFAR